MTHETDFTPDLGETGFATAVLEGLAAPQKHLPCAYFYDARGSRLFEDITRLPEYYPTRTELKILEANVRAIAHATAPGGVLIEYGSGSSRKTEVLLAELELAAYVPIDVSASALFEAKDRLARRYPKLRVEPIVGDFRARLDLPDDLVACPRVGFFPGSTIGNFAPAEATKLLRDMAANLGTGARLIIGVDLRKDVRRLIPAYDDAAGVTAAFNKNLLVRANRELGADFDLDAFQHRALFNDKESRVEMHLVSATNQIVTLLGHDFAFRRGETIHTENSHKYTVASFQALARQAGWRPTNVWTDEDALFSVHELVAA